MNLILKQKTEIENQRRFKLL